MTYNFKNGASIIFIYNRYLPSTCRISAINFSVIMFVKLLISRDLVQPASCFDNPLLHIQGLWLCIVWLVVITLWFHEYWPVWGGHSCIDCLLSMRILLSRTNTRENNLTAFIIFCRGNLLHAKLWTVIQCPGHDGKLQPHRVIILPYRVWDLACWW